MLKFLLPIMVLITSVTQVSAAGWVGGTELKNVYPAYNGGAYFQFDSMDNPDGCANANWYFVDEALAGSQKIFATALAAAVSGKTISLYVSGCTGNYPTVTNAILNV